MHKVVETESVHVRALSATGLHRDLRSRGVTGAVTAASMARAKPHGVFELEWLPNYEEALRAFKDLFP